MTPLPFWIDVCVAGLLVLSGLFVLIAALGFLRLPDFFLRMHPPSLAYTFSSWCVTGAGIFTFSTIKSGAAALHLWLIIIVLSMTVPVTTLLLARVALFRRRLANVPDTPPPLSADRAAAAAPLGPQQNQTG